MMCDRELITMPYHLIKHDNHKHHKHYYNKQIHKAFITWQAIQHTLLDHCTDTITTCLSVITTVILSCIYMILSEMM